MNNEILFLRYLDRQLTEKETEEVENILRENPGQREIFEAIRKKKMIALEALENLNPEGPVVIPPIESIISKTKTEKLNMRFISSQYLRYAAILLVLVALPLSFWLLKTINQPQNASPEFSETIFTETTLTEDLDYYISPNRCWNERELVCTVSEFNN
jgi:hypothetical protein